MASKKTPEQKAAKQQQKKKVDPGYQTRPGERVAKPSGTAKKAARPQVGSESPDNYKGPAGAVKGGKPTVGANTEDAGRASRRKAKKRAARQAERANAPTGGGGGNTATPPGNTNPPPPNTDPVGPSPARLRMEAYVKMAGFPLSMVDALLKASGDGGTITPQSGPEDYLAIAVDNPEFQARYPVIVDRWKARQAGDMSRPLIFPSEVMEYEKELKNAADDYGLSSWVTSPEQIANLINGDVSMAEAVDRINQAGYAAVSAPKEFREAFFKRFGLTEGNLVGFFLDPDKEEGEIKKAVAQGQIVASAMQHGFANSWQTGERLLDRGVNPETAMSGFAAAALTRGLGSGVGETVTEGQMIDAEFGDAAARDKVASVTAQRVGRFSGAGGAVESQQGVTGLSAASTT